MQKKNMTLGLDEAVETAEKETDSKQEFICIDQQH